MDYPETVYSVRKAPSKKVNLNEISRWGVDFPKPKRDTFIYINRWGRIDVKAC